MNRKADDISVIKDIGQRLAQSRRPLIASHVRPDGDAIGSVIALGLVLKEAGKSPVMVLEDSVPSKYKFLVGSEDVITEPDEPFDLTIAVDSADRDRLGKHFKDISIDINIDHHITNDRFAGINLVRPDTAATAAILAETLPEIGFEIEKDAASALLMGIITDTIGFRTSNTGQKELRIAADLIEKGANLADIYYRTLVSQSFSSLQLWGYAMARLEREDGLVWTTITLEDRQRAGYSGRDDADLTNILSAVEGGEISVLFNEQNNGKVKISWRSSSEADVSKIAQQFGGGGHPPAAGAELEGNLEQVQEIILDRTRQYLNSLKKREK